MEDDEQLRQAMEESLRTARAEEERRASEAVVPTAPALPASAPGLSETASEFERQRREAIERQKARWHQMHGQQVPEYSTPQGQQPTGSSQQDAGSFYPSVPAYEAPSGPPDAGRLYPSIPGHSSDGVQAVPEDSVLYPSLQEQQTQPAADPYLDELKRIRQQQEEEDHRLAMQLAQQYSSEDEDAQLYSDDPPAAAAAGIAAPGFGPGPYPSSGEDNDWQQVNRTPSMQQAGATAGAGAASSRLPDRVGGGGSHSSRPSSEAAAAAGSTAGGLLGAGLSALLAMAASAAARSAQQHQQDQQDGASAHASTTGDQQHHASSSSGSDGRQQHSADGAGDAAAAAATGSGSAHGSGVQGLLGMAASALWNYMRGRNSSSSSSTATASSSSSSGRPQEHQQHGSDDQEVVMLQQLMRQLMSGEPPNYQQAAGGSNSRGSGQGTGGFRVTSIPGGGFAATYSSGGNRHQQSGTAAHDPFGPYMDPAQDLITQLLLAGARSAHSNRSQGVDGHEAGFNHYDPTTGSSRFESRDQVFGPGFMGPGFRQVPDQGIEALLGALFGGQGFGRESMGNMRYEDLVNLDNVNVSTPEDILAQLPRSKYVEGRKPEIVIPV